MGVSARNLLIKADFQNAHNKLSTNNVHTHIKPMWIPLFDRECLASPKASILIHVVKPQGIVSFRGHV